MLTYEYECLGCHRRFELEQPITASALNECPECRGQVRRLISAGGGFFIHGATGGSGHHQQRSASECLLTQTGSTCCGRQSRCDNPVCDLEK